VRRTTLADRIPLTEATGHEIVIRTVYQLILADYKLNPEQYDYPATRLFDLSLQWRNAGTDLISDTLQAAACHVANQNTIASWKSLELSVDVTRVVALSMLGRRARR
jgi:hypothetical protein